ncbi:hypothetical protein SEUCBS139899_010327 [Sporothrix eucalyptigena]|uniref:NAD binding Rossmann fold oxidoreductase n=1 Tax=Sporothrix eucalyptigena TaxID=1812306 RepID=A0ABP0CM58_9PEZI
MTSPRRLKIGLIGLGRLGSIRARIIAHHQPRMEFVAACDTKPGADQWAAANLPSSVKFFADPVDMMANGGIEAVLISTATATHAPLILQALDLGLHVMCEKPISVDVLTTEEVLAKAASKPSQVFLVPFTKRYDESYVATKKMLLDGTLGDVHAIETHNSDQQEPNGFFVAFSAQSGGIFVDVGIHDIDIARYFLEPEKSGKKQVNRVFAVGQQAVYGALAKTGDADNGWGLVEFANGKVLQMHVGRTLTNGYESATRVYGTKALSAINGNSTINRVEIRDAHGVRTQTTPDAFTLYDATFYKDLGEFAGAVLDGTPLTCTLNDAYEAAKIVVALQHSFRTGLPVYFDDDGRPIMEGVTSVSKTNGANGHANGTTNGHTNSVAE